MNLPEDISLNPSHAPELKKEATDEISRDEYVLVTETFKVAKRKLEVIYPVKESDLHRIEGLIHEIAPQRKIFSILWPLMGGVSATSLFSLLGFLIVDRVPTLFWEIGLVTLAVSVILGFVFLILDLLEPDKVSRSVEDVLKELKLVKSQFEYGEPPQEEV
jgi:hypothetical protein